MSLLNHRTESTTRTLQRNPKVRCRKQKAYGMTFIEILVSLFILTSGILGAVALQANSIKGSFDSMQRSLATSLAQDIVERMRSNQKTTAVLESYEGTYGESLNSDPGNCNTAGSLCTAQQIATLDLYDWEFNLMGFGIVEDASSGNSVGGLVGGRGCIEHTNNQVTVIVSWQGRTAIRDTFEAGVYDADAVSSCGQSGDQRRQVVVEAFIY